ncbi:MAG: T9SS type A sorting domain-containing protein, partial [Flavobacteriales bacterium]|nr:T9SS type A sorting domain-containing protein [Flavobacteriales bacterium]
MGRIFVPPATESELYLKFDPEIVGGIEVPRIETYMPESVHHFVIYSFNPGADAAYDDGLRNAYDPGALDSHADIKNPIATGPGVWNYQLPVNTAYYWPDNTVFDLNLHIKNESQDSIMSSDIYVNVYTQDVGTTENYMQIRLFPVLDISIPQDNQEHMFTSIANDTNATKTWKIWNIYTHTHKYGSAYNVFTRNASGQADEMIYDGDYSYEQDFPVGWYRNGPEVTFRYFPDNDLYEIDPRSGLIHEAGFTNTDGPDPVEWGLTSDEEMMVLGIQFIEGSSLTGINEIAPIERLQLYPNPARSAFSLSFNLLENAKVKIDLYDVAGRKINALYSGTQPQGMFSQTFDTDQTGLPVGIYFINISVNDAIISRKLILTE